MQVGNCDHLLSLSEMHVDPPAPQLQTPLFPGLCAPTHHTYMSTYPSMDTCVSPQPADHEQCGYQCEDTDRPARPWFQFFGINTQEGVPRAHGTDICNFPGSSIVFSIDIAPVTFPLSDISQPQKDKYRRTSMRNLESQTHRNTEQMGLLGGRQTELLLFWV